MKKLVPVAVVLLLLLFIGDWMMDDPGSLAAYTRDSASWVADTLGSFGGALRDFLQELF